MLLDLGAAINHQAKASSTYCYLLWYYHIKCYAILIYILSVDRHLSCGSSHT